MREIKFRVWDKEKKEMIYQDRHTIFLITDEFVGVDCDETKGDEYREWSWNGTLNCVLMQYTGLFDREGIDIYEGDVIKHPNFGAAIVKYQYASFYPFSDTPFRLKWDADECVVVGNIFEDPELIR